MNRRKFIYHLGLGLAAGLAARRLAWPSFAAASTPVISLAFLADAHLKDGDPGRPETLALARAVAEIKALRPRPDVVLFAGDLAHQGNPQALALGEEILSELPLPVLAVRGEGDGRPQKAAAGWRLFQEGRFYCHLSGVNLLGLDTVGQDTPAGPAYALGEAQRRWLDDVLARLDPAQPLIILSHAPLIPLFRPWGQWTLDSGLLFRHLSRFENVLCCHGHVHQAGAVFVRPPAAADTTLSPQEGEDGGISPAFGPSPVEFSPFPTLPPQGEGSIGSARRGVKIFGLPATSWPLPSPVTGTPSALRPGTGPQGCGWVWLSPANRAASLRQVLWQV
ncbi:MAG: metallophosphoesterase family protein [Desulfobaccales bacterium]